MLGGDAGAGLFAGPEGEPVDAFAGVGDVGEAVVGVFEVEGLEGDGEGGGAGAGEAEGEEAEGNGALEAFGGEGKEEVVEGVGG